MCDAPMPTLHDIIAARPHVYRFLKPTPLHHYPTLSELVGAEVWIRLMVPGSYIRHRCHTSH